MRLISPDEITFTARIGGLDEAGKPRTGVTVKVLRGESRHGGYVVSVSGPAPKLLLQGPS